jgi:hypothetical protein
VRRARDRLWEKNLGDNIVNAARRFGWLVHRDPTFRATAADPGYPDLTLVRGGRIIFAELKSEAGELAPDQIAWRDAITDDIGRVRWYCWRPTDWIAGRIDEILR